MNDKFKELMQKTNPRKVINDLIQEATGYTMTVYEINGVRTLGERVELFDKEMFAELIVKACADAADMAHAAHCKYPGDYVVEQMGFGLVEGVSAFRS